MRAQERRLPELDLDPVGEVRGRHRVDVAEPALEVPRLARLDGDEAARRRGHGEVELEREGAAPARAADLPDVAPDPAAEAEVALRAGRQGDEALRLAVQVVGELVRRELRRVEAHVVVGGVGGAERRDDAGLVRRVQVGGAAVVRPDRAVLRRALGDEAPGDAGEDGRDRARADVPHVDAGPVREQEVAVLELVDPAQAALPLGRSVVERDLGAARVVLEDAGGCAEAGREHVPVRGADRELLGEVDPGHAVGVVEGPQGVPGGVVELEVLAADVRDEQLAVEVDDVEGVADRGDVVDVQQAAARVVLPQGVAVAAAAGAGVRNPDAAVREADAAHVVAARAVLAEVVPGVVEAQDHVGDLVGDPDLRADLEGLDRGRGQRPGRRVQVDVGRVDQAAVHSAEERDGVVGSWSCAVAADEERSRPARRGRGRWSLKSVGSGRGGECFARAASLGGIKIHALPRGRSRTARGAAWR